jgi:hypothetical protein
MQPSESSPLRKTGWLEPAWHVSSRNDHASSAAQPARADVCVFAAAIPCAQSGHPSAHRRRHTSPPTASKRPATTMVRPLTRTATGGSGVCRRAICAAHSSGWSRAEAPPRRELRDRSASATCRISRGAPRVSFARPHHARAGSRPPHSLRGWRSSSHRRWQLSRSASAPRPTPVEASLSPVFPPPERSAPALAL